MAHYKRLIEEKRSALSWKENAIQAAYNEYEGVVDDINSRNEKYEIAAMAVPLFGLIAYEIQKAANRDGDSYRIDMAWNKLEDLRAQKAILSRQEGEAQTQLGLFQSELSQRSVELGKDKHLRFSCAVKLWLGF